MPDTLDRLKAALAERYAIQRELGRGGMDTVYLATDLKHERHVALKVLKPELSAILGAERFPREIELSGGARFFQSRRPTNETSSGADDGRALGRRTR